MIGRRSVIAGRVGEDPFSGSPWIDANDRPGVGIDELDHPSTATRLDGTADVGEWDGVGASFEVDQAITMDQAGS